MGPIVSREREKEREGGGGEGGIQTERDRQTTKVHTQRRIDSSHGSEQEPYWLFPSSSIPIIHFSWILKF